MKGEHWWIDVQKQCRFVDQANIYTLRWDFALGRCFDAWWIRLSDENWDIGLQQVLAIVAIVLQAPSIAYMA